jgi:NAD(P)-dependent dehydrogenase (short-subunit alcohol dehydrogenase family)
MTPLLDGAGKVALVAGAAGGIGTAIGRLFRDAGVRLAGLDLAPAAADLYELAVQGHAADEAVVADAVDATVRRLGRLDFLINAAGITGSGRLDTTSLVDWQRVLDASLTSMFLLTRPWRRPRSR